jgi:hypothetical protein
MNARHYSILFKVFILGSSFTIAFLGPFSVRVHACTIFVLTDTNHVLFCNNEDWSNPKTRIWFVPAGDGYYDCAYIGFDDGWAQGGLNTKGLAFDWVAGYKEIWKPDSNLLIPRGNASQRMLESCATVEEAIAFYQSNQEPGFSYAKILVADSSGASVIIGAKDGKLQIEKANQSRGFGYGKQTFNNLLAKSSESTVTNGFKILQACMQKGAHATKYSNIFDLKSGDIFLRSFSDLNDEVKLNFAVELKKGGHYYDITQIHIQLTQITKPLLTNMRRFIMDGYKPILDTEPKVTAHFHNMFLEIISGTMHTEDYTAEFWKENFSEPERATEYVKPFGDMASLLLVDHSDENGMRSYRYRMEFKKVTLLCHIIFDKENKLTLLDIEDMVWKNSVVGIR